jgi:NADPH:quinone reductase-like Zn-dependent oxidoreductase
MAIVAAEYGKLLQEEDCAKLSQTVPDGPAARFFSSVTTMEVDTAASPLASPYYWVVNLVSPVRFRDAVQKLLQNHHQPSDVLLEIGPHSALAGPVRQICEAAGRPCNYTAAQIRGKNGVTSFLSALGSLYQQSVAVDWKPLFASSSNKRALAGLPAYPWDHSAGGFWYETRLSRDWRGRRFPDHCLLGTRVVETPDTAPQWRNLLNLDNLPWIVDHKVRRDIVFPIAGYVAMAGEAVRQITGGEEAGYRLRHVVARAALVLTEAEPVEVVTALRPLRLTDTDDSTTWYEFAIASYTGSTWIKHCEGQVATLDRAPQRHGALLSVGEYGSLPRQVKTNRLYDAMSRVGLEFGPEFRRLTDIWASVTDNVAQAKLAVPAAEEDHPYPGPMHPASIDACLQMLLIANVQGMCRDFHQLVVPTRIESVEVSDAARHRKTTKTIEAFCPVDGLGSAKVECVVGGQENEPEQVCLRISGLQVTPLDNDTEDDGNGGSASGPIDSHAAAHLYWQPDFDLTPLDKSLIKRPVENIAWRELREKLTLLCILDSADRVSNLTPAQPHFFKYRSWLEREANLARSGDYPLVPDAKAISLLEPLTRRALIESTFNQLVAQADREDANAKNESTGKKVQNAATARAIKRICDHAEGVFTAPAVAVASDRDVSGAAEGADGSTETSDVLNLLSKDGLLAAIYADEGSGSLDFRPLVWRLSHTRAGKLRILEVGAGTGGTTACLLPQLFVPTDEDAGTLGSNNKTVAGSLGLPMYCEYVFTDISAGFFPQAKERFSYAPNMRFATFDISRDPLSQGFEPKTFDLVVAPNVVHATPCLRETLANLRTVLRDDGVLMLTELWTEVRSAGFVFGNFPGWWLGEEDGRYWEPFVSPDRWDAELKAAGFKGAEVVVPDAEPPWQMSAVLLARPRTDSDSLVDSFKSKSNSKGKITLLCQDPASSTAASLLGGLKNEGWDVTPCRLGHDALPCGQDIISCVDLESRFFDLDTLTEESLSTFQAMFRDLQKRKDRILWLMPPFQVKCRDPRGAQTLGVLRTLRTELNLPIFSLELDYGSKKPDEAARLISSVFVKRVQNASDDETLNADREFAIDENNIVLVSRYQPFSLTRAQARPVASEPTTAPTTPITPTSASSFSLVNGVPSPSKLLHIPRPGDLSTLMWIDNPLPTILPPDHVEVKILAAGLNLRDVLVANGTLHLPKASSLLGVEASGIITRVGSDVNNNTSRPRLQAGDQVILISTSGALATRAVVPAELVARLGPSTTPLAPSLFNALAAAPVCYVTAMYSLLEAGRLKSGMSVLVHSACGGLGLAALEVCKWVGNVEVYATVGSEEKIEFLLKRYPGLISRERIFSSRDDSFRDGVLSLTGGRGVDLVLNSLSGDLLHASWECVAKYGAMLELGKRDLLGAARLDMSRFIGNRSYLGLDLFEYCREKPEVVGGMLRKYVDLYQNGLLPLPDPVTYFEHTDVEQAFRHLQNSSHIGKVVVTMPEDPHSIISQPSEQPILLDPEASYLLVGGAGGLGGSVASWLVEHGARHLTILSRNAGVSSESKALFRELELMGCSVTAVTGSVENKDDVVEAISRSGRPIKGVFHLALVLSVSTNPLLRTELWRLPNGELTTYYLSAGRTILESDLERLEPGRRAKGARCLEPAPRARGPAARLLLAGELGGHGDRGAGTGQLRGQLRVPRGLLPVSPLARPPRDRAQHLPGQRRRLRGRERARPPQHQEPRHLHAQRVRVPRLYPLQPDAGRRPEEGSGRRHRGLGPPRLEEPGAGHHGPAQWLRPPAGSSRQQDQLAARPSHGPVSQRETSRRRQARLRWIKDRSHRVLPRQPPPF